MEPTQRTEASPGTSKRKTNPTHLADSLEIKLRLATNSPKWKTDINIRAEFLVWLQNSKDTINHKDWRAALDIVSKALDITTDRLSRILLFDEMSEITRALQVDLSPKLREKEDEIYPEFGWIGDYLQYSQENEAPLAYHFWTAIAVLGAAAKRNFYLDQGNFYIYPNHYILIAGPSGNKKSTSFSLGQGLLERCNSILSDTPNIHDAEHIRMTPEKISPEAFLSIMKAKKIPDRNTGLPKYVDSTCFVGISELAVLLGKNVFHSDFFIHLLTSLYDCPNTFVVTTIARGKETLKNVAISLVACSTREWMEQSVTSELFTGGFMGRCILVPRGYSLKEFPTAGFIDPVRATILSEKLAEIASSRKQQMYIEDRPWFNDWYKANKQQLVAQTDERMRGYYSRRDKHLLRLSMVFAIAEGKNMITEEYMTKASEILQHEEVFLKETLSLVGQHPQTQITEKVFEAISDKNGWIQRSELSRRTSRFTGGARYLDGSLSDLVDQGRVIRRIKGKVRFYHSIGPNEPKLPQLPEE